MKKKKTEFYLLKQKSLSEGDLFITDYIKTKQRLKKLTNELDILKLRVDNLKNNKKKVIKLYENE
jgi:3-dehydroquinate dehydratase